MEGRKGVQKYRDLKPGDQVCFQCTGTKKTFLASVEKVDCFDSIDDYLKEVTVEKALPGVKTFEEALQIYSQWSTPEQIQQLGFVGIWITVQQ